jgi:hypothetical protein
MPNEATQLLPRWLITVGCAGDTGAITQQEFEALKAKALA